MALQFDLKTVSRNRNCLEALRVGIEQLGHLRNMCQLRKYFSHSRIGPNPARLLKTSSAERTGPCIRSVEIFPKNTLRPGYPRG